MRKTVRDRSSRYGADEGPTEPRRGAPVHEPRVVVRVALPERVELDAAAAEDRLEVPAGEGAREGRRGEKKAPYPVVESVRFHANGYGNVKVERTRAMTASASIPSASAS